jgi:hypothetical protein
VQAVTVQAGDYRVQAVGDPVFEPFPATVEDGKTTAVKMGGWLAFNWPGEDFWYAYRGDKVAARARGSAKLALQAGTYTVKPIGAAFEPFEVTIEDGVTVTVP